MTSLCQSVFAQDGKKKRFEGGGAASFFLGGGSCAGRFAASSERKIEASCARPKSEMGRGGGILPPPQEQHRKTVWTVNLPFFFSSA